MLSDLWISGTFNGTYRNYLEVIQL